ncbi:Uncharacterised protein [Bordetella pertussis]|nr:Uncharacterised protein [Bordetella pertussis]CFN80109.1 Uncharacterised protein [Bordetella pertussis]CFO01390.1 Uncharacterised protein [Bordetella pertussis]CFO42614.1 Uncharacterised protein [Bordetella pertussis]CFO60692.1 Uncharacterised protein [Bordetella pertussis]
MPDGLDRAFVAQMPPAPRPQLPVHVQIAAALDARLPRLQRHVVERRRHRRPVPVAQPIVQIREAAPETIATAAHRILAGVPYMAGQRRPVLDTRGIQTQIAARPHAAQIVDERVPRRQPHAAPGLDQRRLAVGDSARPQRHIRPRPQQGAGCVVQRPGRRGQLEVPAGDDGLPVVDIPLRLHVQAARDADFGVDAQRPGLDAQSA